MLPRAWRLWLAVVALCCCSCSDKVVLGRVAPAKDPKPGDVKDPSSGGVTDDAFSGPENPDPNAAPRMVYPLDGVVLGRGVPDMLFQWHAGANNTLFRVRIVSALAPTDALAPLLAGITACPDSKCRMAVPNDRWAAVGQALAGSSAQLVVDAVAAPGGPVAHSAPVRFSFAADPLEGDIYFFTIPGPGYVGGTVSRADVTGSSSQVVANAANTVTRGQCVACHTVSRDGCRLSMNHFDAGTIAADKVYPDRELSVVSALEPTRELAPAKTASAFQTYSPDGSRMLTVSLGQLTLRDAVGKKLMDVPRSLVGPAGRDAATHPDWSPDGQTLVFTRLHEGATFYDDPFHSGDIMTMPYNDGAFGPAKVLVASTKSEFHYYPAFSPDSRFIAFSSGTAPGQAPNRNVAANTYDPYDQTESRLRLVSVSGGAPVELARATQGARKAASWPHFSPHLRDGRHAFIVFSSKVDYGFVVEQALVPSIDDRYFGRAQLWAAAVDLGAPTGEDPSAAPFWLPFQNPLLRNHSGQWIGTPTARLKCP